MNWAFGGPPVKFVGMGGRQSRGSIPGNIWDHFAVEMEYPGGARVMSMCRHTPKSTPRVAEHLVGSKGVADLNQQFLATIKGAKPLYSRPTLTARQAHHLSSIRERALNEQVAISCMTAIGVASRPTPAASVVEVADGGFDLPKECKPAPGFTR